MKKKGCANKRKKWIRRLPRKKVSRKWGYIPRERHFCIICKLLKLGINTKELTVHHDIPRSKEGKNNPKNLEIICKKHHDQLHHPIFYQRAKYVYKQYRKAKFNKIQTT